MKLSIYAKQLVISHQTAWRRFRDGKLNAYRLPTGTVIVEEDPSEEAKSSAFVYCRVSSFERKGHLKSKQQWLLDYCAAKRYRVGQVAIEVGLGVDGTRRQWLSLPRGIVADITSSCAKLCG